MSIPVVKAEAVREVNALLEEQLELLRDIKQEAEGIQTVMVAVANATNQVVQNVGEAIELQDELADRASHYAHPGGPPDPSVN